MKTLETLLERTILLSRWLLAPIYLALAAVLAAPRLADQLGPQRQARPAA